MEKVCDLLLHENANYDFGLSTRVKARSRNTGAIVKTLLSIVITWLHGNAWWISSIIMRRKKLLMLFRKLMPVQQARDEPALGNTHSAFFQASYLEEIYWMRGLIDLPLVDMQDEEMTDATRQRWQSEKVRYTSTYR